jgi:RND family efflux transporter MFP subunit
MKKECHSRLVHDRRYAVMLAWVLLASLAGAGCRANADSDPVAGAAAPPPVAVTTDTATEQRIARFIRVSGTLTPEEEADVAAETAGRIVSTPVERGTLVAAGAELVRIASTEADAQAQEAEANAAQVEARLAMTGSDHLDIERVPEVANARAAADQAQADFERTQMLMERRLISPSEFEQRRTQTETARRQLEVARSAAEQQYQSLLAARARLALARKALADTSVRAPFDGVIGERLVSVGDYVTRGTKVAHVMRVSTLRVELTVPEQYIATVSAGRAVEFEVDAYPGRTFTGRVRYVSPALKADSRALVVEALVPNEGRLLKPGFFATARIEQASPSPALVVPASAVRVGAGASRLFVVSGDHVEERVIALGEAVDGERLEVTGGLKAGERVATSNVAQLSDGARIAVRK